MSMLNSGMGMVIDNGLGKLVKVETSNGGYNCGDILRVRVWIDVTKPLKHALNVHGGMKGSLIVTFAYERLPNFCYRCGLLGHLLHDCSMEFTDPSSDEVDMNSLDYGDWLRAESLGNRSKLLNSNLRGQSSRVFVEHPATGVESASGGAGVVTRVPVDTSGPIQYYHQFIILVQLFW